ARISTHATEAAKAAGAKIIRLERPAWKAEADDRWHHVPSVEEAVHLIPDGASTLVTIGRQQLGAFLDRDDINVVARAIEGPKITVPESWTVILDRPPFPLAEEIALFEKYEIDVLVTKNAGGTETRDKLLAARALEKPVIMIDRLPKPDVETYATMETLLSRLETL
ncbi:MAG: precorrin-6A/cobalt-precorrin-6A reductase, partial [Pseudomonadota bacterium]